LRLNVTYDGEKFCARVLLYNITVFPVALSEGKINFLFLFLFFYFLFFYFFIFYFFIFYFFIVLRLGNKKLDVCKLQINTKCVIFHGCTDVFNFFTFARLSNSLLHW
jgi:hypothetical protein